MVALLATEAIQSALIADRQGITNITAQRSYQTGSFGKNIEYLPTPMVLLLVLGGTEATPIHGVSGTPIVGVLTISYKREKNLLLLPPDPPPHVLAVFVETKGIPVGIAKRWNLF